MAGLPPMHSVSVAKKTAESITPSEQTVFNNSIVFTPE